jgi:hypothetical protein
MKFPISRESLQAFDIAKEQEELQEEEIQKRFTQILDQLCLEFKQRMPSNSTEKKFVWRGLHSIGQIQMLQRLDGGIPYSSLQNSNMNRGLPIFVEKLKKVFIGCDIIISTRYRHIIIDWS